MQRPTTPSLLTTFIASTIPAPPTPSIPTTSSTVPSIFTAPIVPTPNLPTPLLPSAHSLPNSSTFVSLPSAWVEDFYDEYSHSEGRPNSNQSCFACTQENIALKFVIEHKRESGIRKTKKRIIGKIHDKLLTQQPQRSCSVMVDIDEDMYHMLGLNLHQACAPSQAAFGGERKLTSTATHAGRLPIAELCKMLGPSFWYSIVGEQVHFIEPTTRTRNLDGVWLSFKSKQICSIGNYVKQHTRKRRGFANQKTIKMSCVTGELKLTFTVIETNVDIFCNVIFAQIMGTSYPTPENLYPYSNRIVID